MTDAAPSNGAGARILARERQALDRWSQGQTTGYADVADDDITYFDDIGAQARVAGKPAVREYLTGLEGQIPPHNYEMVDPRVQVYGDVGVLTFLYHPSGPDGEPGQRWKATSVYRNVDGEWWAVHAHWSMIKAP